MRGFDAEATETVRATTIVKTLHIRPSGFEGENSNIPPTPDLYQQLLYKISEKGNDGKLAFEIAVEHGFVGTEAEWLESLKGADGRNGITPDMSNYVTKADIAELQKQIKKISGIHYISAFESGSDALQKYGDSIYTYYNNGYRSIAGFAESYTHFCCSENEYTLYFNQNDFSWAGTVFVMFLTPVAITSKMKLLLNLYGGCITGR